MYLFEADVEKAIRMFKDMINCRLMHEQKQLLKRKGERAQVVLYEFRPYVSEKSTQLATRSKSRAKSPG